MSDFNVYVNLTRVSADGNPSRCDSASLEVQPTASCRTVA